MVCSGYLHSMLQAQIQTRLFPVTGVACITAAFIRCFGSKFQRFLAFTLQRTPL